ncbi:hypothetical protein JJJ17_03565 [Paracoccus caeni]|uniref:Uncharacterized protein n=1 Tax=Paracoccus caeni TaxID=657651 RepID=A0A934SGY6_9RHOB|nr:hypothetical protein [Paracoccus caeni]MBK4214999.1 hypothetical protein [Paracoccus caeni]
MLTALALMAATAAPLEDLHLLPDSAAFAEEAGQWLLQGQPLPRDYRARLMRMPPDARLETLIFLRRTGLLRGDIWTLEQILRPVVSAAEGGE